MSKWDSYFYLNRSPIARDFLIATIDTADALMDAGEWIELRDISPVKVFDITSRHPRYYSDRWYPKDFGNIYKQFFSDVFEDKLDYWKRTQEFPFQDDTTLAYVYLRPYDPVPIFEYPHETPFDTRMANPTPSTEDSTRPSLKPALVTLEDAEKYVKDRNYIVVAKITVRELYDFLFKHKIYVALKMYTKAIRNDYNADGHFFEVRWQHLLYWTTDPSSYYKFKWDTVLDHVYLYIYEPCSILEYPYNPSPFGENLHFRACVPREKERPGYGGYLDYQQSEPTEVYLTFSRKLLEFCKNQDVNRCCWTNSHRSKSPNQRCTTKLKTQHGQKYLCQGCDKSARGHGGRIPLLCVCCMSNYTFAMRAICHECCGKFLDQDMFMKERIKGEDYDEWVVRKMETRLEDDLSKLAIFQSTCARKRALERYEEMPTEDSPPPKKAPQ